ncbi:hypothetical protein ABZX85_11570 [Streptomyces sp. NPDC004539]
MRDQIQELWSDYLESGGEALPLLKLLIDETWEQLTGDDIAELQRFLSY